MHSGEPTCIPVPVSAVAWAACAIPKSIRPQPVSGSTFDGFRSRCTSPAPWIACSVSATPASSSNTVGAGIGPCSATAWPSDGPAT